MIKHQAVWTHSGGNRRGEPDPCVGLNSPGGQSRGQWRRCAPQPRSTDALREVACERIAYVGGHGIDRVPIRRVIDTGCERGTAP